MRIFLTGCSGFIGSHLLKELVKNNHELAILSRGKVNHENTSLYKNILMLTGDLAKPNDFREELAKFKPDAVIHLAWSGVENLYRNEIRQVENLSYSLELMKVAHYAGAKHWLALGSQAEYGPHNEIIDEKAITEPTTTYGVIKLATALATKELAACLGIRFSWLRLFSVYGPGDRGNWFIPFLIKSLIKGDSPDLTEGKQLWDYLHVKDVALAICKVLETPDAFGIFNLGSGKAFRISEIAEYIRDKINPSISLSLGAIPYRDDQVMFMQADITNISTATGWQPTIRLFDGLNDTCEWYQKEAQK